MNNKLQLSTAQNILLSPYMRQALMVLQMSFCDLCDWLSLQVEKNPFLEWSTQWPPSFPHLELIDFPYRPSPFVRLYEQAQIAIKDPHLLSIAIWIFGNLDAKGFFVPEPPYPFSKAEIQACLSIIQDLEPPGIGSRSLQEYLLFQLRHKQASLLYRLIQEHFNALLHKQWDILTKHYAISKRALSTLLHQELFPLRLTLFDEPNLADTASYTDIIFSDEVVINDPPLPIWSSYPILSSFSKEEKSMLLSYKSHAKEVCNIMLFRSQTILRIATYVFHMQSAFLQGKTNSLVPLTLQEASKELHLHTSTLTRALHNKIISCAQGRMPLRALFSRPLTQENSYDHAQKLLLRLIQEENKDNPFSDEELAKKMQDLGIPCSRRVLTKYRHNLNIPSKYYRS